ncbi:allantoinase [Spinactinospora alkalitolerans]|uniref:Allantoinase n=1 Tax=Spinactinospora alkalitolerans TaxID=687207 RepID=A0A852TPQ9_9ACTN|nr:dihydroorotase family protein [Spinactinospora alkalitolerans]NYE45979.1 allantoinase [Spinactinospora alkalitolerans]
MSEFDLIISNVRVVRPDTDTVRTGDIAVRDGRVAEIAEGIDAARALETVDGGGRLAFPGAVDAHQHWGIYNPLEIDARTESRASAQGGVTTGLTYIRTGQYYLNKGGDYADFFPEVLQRAQGAAHVDYAFHVAPMQRSHLDELDALVDEFGVTSFKIFMFYGSHGLHGRSADQASFLMTPPGERYDIAHFEFVMRALQGVRERHPEIAERISLSLHCETAEIMAAYTRMVEEEGELSGLAAYSASRPPHSEGLAVTIASYLAHETGLPTINLLHLSSAKALEAALTMARAFPHIDFRREVTLGHLLTDIDTAHGVGGKVNPPIRPRDDVEALWRHVLAGEVDWVVSDHACCKDEAKFGADRDDVFLAKSGFGGAEYLLPGLVSEGRKRGLSDPAVARLVSWNPAQRYGLTGKGTIAPGYDADIALVDPDAPWTVRAEDSESTQEYTPFEGVEIGARVTDVFLRGTRIVDAGKVVGDPHGAYIRRNR